MKKIQKAALWLLLIKDNAKRIATVVFFFVPVALLIWLFAGEDRIVQAPETATYLQHRADQTDVGVRRYWVVELSNNVVLDLRAQPNTWPKPGDLLCVTRLTGEATGLTRLRFVQMGACPSSE
ncbi:MAG: hypothetical protein AAGD13_01155 [Pseudomonadota bacterium]